MWNYSEEIWKKELLRAAKVETFPEFFKTLGTDIQISPFSRPDQRHFQKDHLINDPFLTVQNYADLKKSELQEWLALPQVGVRFRRLEDLKEFYQNKDLQKKSVFLSQPFPYLIEESDKEILAPVLSQLGSLNLGWSPLSFGLTRGEILKNPFANWEKIFQQNEIKDPRIKWFYLSSAPYQWAGAEPHVELSVLLSLGYAVVKELSAMGIPLKESVTRMTFGLALGADVLRESAKVTALKTLWSRLIELHDDSVDAKVPVYVLPSLREFSGRDPWNNVMRMTLMAFAGMAGGAQGFKCIPYDALNSQKTMDALRVSTNIPLILQKEGYMDIVKNPFDGSSLFADAVEALCASAWSHFQEMESKGGVFEAVRSGWLQAEVKRSHEISQQQMSYGEKELIGINKFVVKNSPYSKSSQLIKLNDIVDPLFLKKSDDDFLSVEPLMVSSLSYEWERLQVQSDRLLEEKGQRPFVVIARTEGEISDKKTAWLQSLLALAGIEAKLINKDAIQSIDAAQNLILLVPGGVESEDEWLSLLKKQGVEKVWSTGASRQGTAVDRYLDVKMNRLDFVQSVHRLRGEVL